MTAKKTTKNRKNAREKKDSSHDREFLKNQLSFRLKKLLSSISWRLNMYRFLTQRAAQLTVRDVLCVWHRQNHQLDINDFNYSFFFCAIPLFGEAFRLKMGISWFANIFFIFHEYLSQAQKFERSKAKRQSASSTYLVGSFHFIYYQCPFTRYKFQCNLLYPAHICVVIEL